jgi:peptide/nickel transport system substrate-binding protein
VARAPNESKALTLGFRVFPTSPGGKLKGGGEGTVALHWLWNGYLTGLDARGQPQPILAEALPSLENGTWTVRPDNTMETVWKIRPASRWQDGRPIVPSDFLLAWQVINDTGMPVSGRAVESLISDIEIPDERTLVLVWKELYIGANEMNGDTLPPLPNHLIGDLYRNDKQAFIDSDYWTADYIGAGPFQVEQWDPVNNLIVSQAHQGYALGRPKIDRIRLVFYADEQTMLTNVMAGAIDVIVSPAITTPSSVVLKDSWESQGSGRVSYSPGLLDVGAFQLREVPNAQRALRDKRVRQALVYATDRQAAVDTMPPGVLIPADYPIALTDLMYPAVQRAVPKYDYNPARAEQLLDSAGWPRGAGGVRRNADGDNLDVSIMASGSESGLLTTIMADYWKRVGVDASTMAIPGARALDREFVSSHSGVYYKPLIPQWIRVDWVSEQIPSPATRFLGRNTGGYGSPEMDVLIRRVQTTLDPRERERYVVELLATWQEDAGFFSHLFRPAVIAAAKGVSGYDTEVWPAQNAHTWNIYQWTRD